MSRYRFVSAMKVEGFSIQAACEVADVTRSSYYDWLERSEAPTGADWDEAVLLNEIHLVHDHLDDTYGSPRMTAELRARGFCVNHKRVERLMAVNGLHARDARRRRVRTTISGGAPPPLPDLIGRDFSVGAPRRRSCGDITYVPTDEGWLYVASVLDLGSRRLIGLAMDGHMRSELVERALRDALGQSSGSLATMIFHHDRGSQYLGRDFTALCEHLGVRQSVGRVASCHDNAAAESFWATLKRELVDRHRFETREQAMAAISAWVVHYNTRRRHSSLGQITPLDWELRFAIEARKAA